MAILFKYDNEGVEKVVYHQWSNCGSSSNLASYGRLIMGILAKSDQIGDRWSPVWSVVLGTLASLQLVQMTRGNGSYQLYKLGGSIFRTDGFLDTLGGWITTSGQLERRDKQGVVTNVSPGHLTDVGTRHMCF